MKTSTSTTTVPTAAEAALHLATIDVLERSGAKNLNEYFERRDAAAARAASLPVAIYCRISRDRGGEGLGVERQEADCRALAERLGLSVSGVYVDNDISAYSGKARPEYERLMRDIEAGRIGGILAWHPDRLYRRMADLEPLIELVERRNVDVRTVTAGDLDLGTSTGRMTARIIGAVAQKEVEQTRDRIRAQKRQASLQGVYRGGVRPFGYEKDGTLRESEADVVRRATRALLAGRTLLGITNELTAEGSRTSTGRTWTSAQLRAVLMRPRNAGLIHTGRSEKGQATIIGPAQWPAIVTEDEWRAVYDLLRDPTRRTNAATGNQPRHLLAGIARCGVDDCDAPMRTQAVRGVWHYRCKASQHNIVVGDRADKRVLDRLVDLVRDPRIVAALTPDSTEAFAADRARRKVLTTSLEQTERDYDDDLIDARRYKSKVDRITAELDEIEARLADGLRHTVSNEVLAAVDPGQALLNAPVDVQRAVLRTLVEVTVLKSLGRGRTWRPERVRVTGIIHVDADDDLDAAEEIPA